MLTLYFTVKEWNKFDWDKQHILTKKYSVILLDYKTKKEKMLQFLDKINFKNINKGIDVFNKSIQQFGGSMSKMNDELSADIKKSNESARISEEKSRQNLEKIWGKPRKLQNNTVKFWLDHPNTDADQQKSDRGIW